MSHYSNEELKKICSSPSSLQIGFHEVFTTSGPISENVYFSMDKRLIITVIVSAVRDAQYSAYEIPSEVDSVEKLFKCPGFFGPAIPQLRDLHPALYEKLNIALTPGLCCQDSKHAFYPHEELTGLQSFKCCYCGKTFIWGNNPGYWLHYRGSTVDGNTIVWPGTKYLRSVITGFSLSYGSSIVRYVSLEGSTLKVESRSVGEEYEASGSFQIPLEYKQKNRLIEYVRSMPLHQWETCDDTLRTMDSGSGAPLYESGVFSCNVGPRFICYDAWRYPEFYALCCRLEALIGEHSGKKGGKIPFPTARPDGVNAKLIKCRCITWDHDSADEEGAIPTDYKYCPRCGTELDGSEPNYIKTIFRAEDTVWSCNCGAIMPKSHRHCGYCGRKR